MAKKKKQFDFESLRQLRDDLAANGLDVSNIDVVIGTAEQAEMDTGEETNVRELLMVFIDPSLPVTTPGADVLRTVALQLLKDTDEAATLQGLLKAKAQICELTKL